MLLELYGVFGIFIVLLFAYTEIGEKKKPVGIFATLLTLLLGIVFIISDVHYVNGSTQVQVTSGNTTTTVITPIIATATLPAPPFPTTMSYSGLLGLSLVLLAMYGMLHYSDNFLW
jgi:uncharacterized membrane protein HdeD (DUF308 family)